MLFDGRMSCKENRNLYLAVSVIGLEQLSDLLERGKVCIVCLYECVRVCMCVSRSVSVSVSVSVSASLSCVMSLCLCGFMCQCLYLSLCPLNMV